MKYQSNVLWRLTWLCWVALWVNLTTMPFAMAETPLSYDQARKLLRHQSDAIQAANYQVVYP